MMGDLLINKDIDREVYFSFDRRCHDISELQAMFDLIGYEVRKHGQEKDGYQDYFFLDPKKTRLVNDERSN